ncbi:MAG TPA: DUF4369 domain-containing protein [Prolixibacteraceae bacterium]|nr:DUF4369 domain-containing protein [Prolixibacteraceae bacterium]
MLRYIVFLFLLTACQNDLKYTITGQLQDSTFNGEWIYLVPLENTSKESVDSVMIANETFQFEGSAESPEIYIIRTKPILRLTLQELLVVKEHGELIVKIGKNSSVNGTALNDSLQQWKEKKMQADYLNEELRQKYKIADIAEQAVIKQKSDSLNARIIDFHFNFVRNNKDNIVGQFVQKIMAGSFSPEQKTKLNIK